MEKRILVCDLCKKHAYEAVEHFELLGTISKQKSTLDVCKKHLKLLPLAPPSSSNGSHPRMALEEAQALRLKLTSLLRKAKKPMLASELFKPFSNGYSSNWKDSVLRTMLKERLIKRTSQGMYTAR